MAFARWLICPRIVFACTGALATEADEALIEASWRVDLQDTLDALPVDMHVQIITNRHNTITAELTEASSLLNSALDRGDVAAIDVEAMNRRARRLATRQLHLVDRSGALRQAVSSLLAERQAEEPAGPFGTLSDALKNNALAQNGLVKQARSMLELSGRDAAKQVAFERDVTMFIDRLQRHRERAGVQR